MRNVRDVTHAWLYVRHIWMRTHRDDGVQHATLPRLVHQEGEELIRLRQACENPRRCVLRM
jgi:hypothetical protein